MIVTTTAEATVEPTEDEKKVERAILKLFPSGRPGRRVDEGNPVGVYVQGNGLDFLATLRNLIRQERIRNTARTIFLRNARDRVLQIYLNKQAAFMGRVSFCAPTGESPHGPVSVTVESDEIQTVIDYLAQTVVDESSQKNRRPRRSLEEE